MTDQTPKCTDVTDEQYVSAVKEAVSTLNTYTQEAARAGITVELDVTDHRYIGHTVSQPFVSVRMRRITVVDF